MANCFQQTQGMPVAAALETLLINAANSSSNEDKYPDELEMYSKDLNIERLLIQLKMIPDLLKTYNEKNSHVQIKKVSNLCTLVEVMNDLSGSKSLFSEVFKMLQMLLTIPVSTAMAERSFSVL